MALSKDQAQIAMGVAAALAVGYGVYTFMQTAEPAGSSPEAPGAAPAVQKHFTDPDCPDIVPLWEKEAMQRSKDISNVSYKLAYALLRGGETFHGQVEINFTLTEAKDSIFADYKGQEVHKIIVNGKQVEDSKAYRNQKIYFPKEFLKSGENKVVIRFVSKYVRDCQGIHYFLDKDDQEEYLYSQFEANDAHKAFPCFDQPDLKAPYTLLALVPKPWVAISTVKQCKATSVSGSQEYSKQLSSFDLNEQEFTALYGDEGASCYEFGKSPLLSVYLYSIVAGPYVTFESDKPEIKNFKFPLRLFSRKSIAKYVEKAKEDYLHVTKCGIEYYETLFSTPYPFDKLDQAFVPDYSNGAMENVGCVIYRDEYVQRDELFSDARKQAIYNVFLHEISHMWFGNLVTMKWWSDLWLNESFANYVSYICLDEAPGLEEHKDAWSCFLDESFWGLGEDQKNTTHPISVEVIHTEMAQDIFDGISYGKGASWLNQMFNYFGREVFKVGVASYFKEFSFKNTELSDFIKHMAAAAKTVGIKEDLEAWCNTWLKAAGCNIIWHDIQEEDGKIKKFTVNQRVNQHGEGNKLRVQKYECAFYDENMKIIKVVDIVTKDDKETFDIEELAGQPAPYAYHINYQNHGFAKFKIDEKSLAAFEKSLTKIEDSMSRKQLYNIMYDMLRAQDISGARLLNICKTQLVSETSVGVINDVMKFVIPSVIKNNIPLSIYESSHHDIFELILDNILTSGNLKDNATRHVVLEAMLSSARNEDHIQLVKKWFKDGFVTNSAGKKLEDVEVSLKHKHTIMERIWSSDKIPLSEKEALMEDLKALDKSDWLDNTQKVCEASHPANKAKMWDLYFSKKESEMDKWGLRSFQMSFRGFNQCQHRDHLAQFEDSFFTSIVEIVESKGRFVAEAYFHILKPSVKCDDAFIKKYEDLLSKVQKEKPDNTFLINMLKDTITDLKDKQKGVKCSEEYLKK